VVDTATADAVTAAGNPKYRSGRQTRFAASIIPSTNLTERTGENLPKEDAIEVMGKVVEKFRAGMFTVELDAGQPVLATMAGKLRRNRIKVMTGDRVSLELSPYDLTKGRITYRHK